MKRMVGLLLALCALLSMTAAGAEEYFTYGYILGDDAAAAVMYEGRKKLGAVQADRSKEIAEVKLFYGCRHPSGGR